MSEQAHDTHDHGHADDGAVHAHIGSPRFYVAIFFALLIFTVLTVAQSYVDMGKLNLLFVILIATAKASLVVTFFMHLKDDNRFHALIFVCGLLFIGVFFTYTMNDTDRRGEIEETSSVWIDPKTGLRAPGGFDPVAAEAEHKKEAAEEEKKEHPGATHTGPEKDKAAPEHH